MIFINPRATRHGRNGGFTLIELLVVIAIIGILGSITLAALSSSRHKAEDSRRIQDLTQIKNAVELYASKHEGNYPTISTSANSRPVFAEVQEKRAGLRSLFGTPAYAAAPISHTSSACHDFDLLAQKLIIDGDIQTEPVDPNDSPDGDCYRAWSDGTTVVVYASMWEKYQNVLGSGQSAANKQAGFVSSREEISRSSLASICTKVKAARASDPIPTAYPIIGLRLGADSVCVEDPSNQLVADRVLGFTSGSEVVDGSTPGGGSNGGGGGMILLGVGGHCEFSDECSSKSCIGQLCQAESGGLGCSANSECQTEICTNGQCTVAATSTVNGLSCSVDADCNSTHCLGGICNAFLDEGHACMASSDCASNDCISGSCAAVEEDNATTTDSGLSNGAACTSDLSCSSLHCLSGMCGTLGDGEYCYGNYECTSNSCSGNLCGTEDTGGGSLQNGTVCAVNGDCSSNVCKTSLATPLCVGNMADGHICESNYDCTSGTCKEGTCFTAPPNKGYANGANCTEGNDCASTHCVSGLCNAFKADGDNCTHGYECRGFECDYNACTTGSSTLSGLGNGMFCTDNGDCASTHCNGSQCSAYAPGQGEGDSCSINADCSTGNICHIGFCAAPVTDCKDPSANNYNASADISDPSACEYDVECNDPAATNYRSTSTSALDCEY